MSKLASLIGLLALAAACGDDGTTPTTGGGGFGTGGGGGATGGGGAGAGGEGGTGGADVDPSAICTELDLDADARSRGPYGAQRGDVADDFSLELVGGATWSFEERFSGCETYVFVPDTLVVSDLDDTSIWEKDLDQLIADSPKNTHYFFVSRKAAEDDAAANVEAMQLEVERVLEMLPEEDAAHWSSRLHVVATRASMIDGWVGDVLSGLGRGGFAIDRTQRIRGLGFLADVDRYSAVLANQGAWPWKSNLAYAAKEAQYLDAQGDERARLAAEDATVVPLWSGEVLAEFAEIDVDLPDAATISGFDTLEIEIEQACPDPEEIEFGNCGAWDYLATLAVRGPTDENIEMARFITSYHRETHWVVDATPMLALLAEGGTHHFRWDFAPAWNTQPTATKLSLRFSNRGKGYAPSAITRMWTGGPFNAAYNAAHLPVDVDIPADAARVELFTIVTGHGAGQSSCSEFCNHQHEITLGADAFEKAFPEAGTEDLCVPQLMNGMVPNQGGTWWFGRGGWCPGQQVEPWVEDVTDLVTPGETATLSYRASFDDGEPPDNSGDIVLSSYLVVYR